MRTLVAGPWFGEFGWQIMTWVPAIRKYSREFDKTVVICCIGYEYLYQDFSEFFIHDSRKGLPDRWLIDGEKYNVNSEVLKLFPEAEFRRPGKKICSEWDREYIKYGMKLDDYAYDLVIHARAETKYNQRSWNWPVPRYRKLVKELKLKKVCSIGTSAHHIEDTEDLRNISLYRLCNILASSKVLLTPSSGPGHLASLCKCPHVIMTDQKWQKSVGGSNRHRYKKIWNPFGTECKILDRHDWQPPVPVVLKALESFLV